MASLKLKLHQKIFVYIKHKEDQYISKIEDFNDKEIYISIPMSQTSLLTAGVGEHLTIRLTPKLTALNLQPRLSEKKLTTFLYIYQFIFNRMTELRRDGKV